MHWEFVHGHPFGPGTTRTLRGVMPSPRLATVLPAFDLCEGTLPTGSVLSVRPTDARTRLLLR